VTEHLLASARERIGRYEAREAQRRALNEGSMSLAAVSLRGVGHARVADLVGGFQAWREAGLETIPAPAPPEGLPGMGGPDR
jgi:3-mercaptopyruvate sulfurtransferase SseA